MTTHAATAITFGLLAALLAPGCAAPVATAPDVAGAPTVRDRTDSGAPHAPDDAAPAHASTRAFVPWDSTAILAVAHEDDHPDVPAGALIVRYGKSWSIDDGDVATIYVLESAGHTVEPVAIEWQSPSGHDLRAFARVDGVLRRYDFDR